MKVKFIHWTHGTRFFFTSYHNSSLFASFHDSERLPVFTLAYFSFTVADGFLRGWGGLTSGSWLASSMTQNTNYTAEWPIGDDNSQSYRINLFNILNKFYSNSFFKSMYSCRLYPFKMFCILFNCEKKAWVMEYTWSIITSEHDSEWPETIPKGTWKHCRLLSGQREVSLWLCHYCLWRGVFYKPFILK